MKIHFVQKQHQSLNLSPQLLQSLSVLQMNSEELYNYLLEQAVENPVIDFELIERDEYFYKHRTRNTISTEQPDISQYCEAKTQSIENDLRLQLSMLRLDTEVERMAEFFIYNLDENGYLKELYPMLWEKCPNMKELLDAGLNALQSLEPAGIGAVDLRSCLLLQLERMDAKESCAWRIVKEHFALLTKNKLPDISKALNVPIRTVSLAYQKIKALNPRPLLGVQDEQSNYIIPDIVVREVQGGLDVEINQVNPKAIQVQKCYSKISAGDMGKDATCYLKNNVQKANALKRCLHQRKNTMVILTNQLLEQQKSFFLQGPKSLRPYRRVELAERTGLHESTVCRALKGKYVKCKWGIFPVSIFFKKQVGEGRYEVTKEMAIAAIKELIKNEPQHKPYSDQRISEMLRQKILTYLVER